MPLCRQPPEAADRLSAVSSSGRSLDTPQLPAGVPLRGGTSQSPACRIPHGIGRTPSVPTPLGAVRTQGFVTLCRRVGKTETQPSLARLEVYRRAPEPALRRI